MKFTLRYFIGLVFLAGFQAFGFEASLTVNPPVIALGDAAQIKVEVRDAKRPGRPNFPAVSGLRYSGTSQSSNTSIVNGRVDKSVSYTVNVYPQRTGEFTIGPFNYTVGTETKQLTGTVKVVATSGDATQAQSWNDVVFGEIRSSRQTTYVQEPFEVSLFVYSRTDIQLSGNINLQGLPETGLSEPAWEEVQQNKREQIDGVLYNVRQFKTPLRTMGSGEYRFAPTVTVQVVAPRQQRQQRNPFGGFFNQVQTIPVELPIKELMVNVRPLPHAGKPSGFTGVVGRFDFKVAASPTEVHPGDPITLQIDIFGEGNFDRIMSPELSKEAPFRLFGDAIRQHGKNGVRFEQAISPQDASVTAIPSISFSFFDSQTGQYRTLNSPEIPITVTASSNDSAQLFVANDTMVIAPADQPFASESDVQRFLNWFSGIWNTIRPWLWTLPVAVGLALLLRGVQKFYHWRRKDTAWLRRKQAPKAARAALRSAEKALNDEHWPDFFEALDEALSSYFGNRLNLSPGDVTSTVVMDRLLAAGVEPDLIATLRSLFDQVEASRYGMIPEQELSKETRNLKTEIHAVLQVLEKVRL